MDKKVEDQSLMHSVTGEKTSFLSMKIVAIFLVVIIVGILSGYLLSGGSKAIGGHASVTTGANLTKNQIQVGQSYGSADPTIDKDTAEGVMQSGGIDGEGQYHLVRPGGDSQNVYLTSSSVDLSLFIKHKVKVWGATQTAQHAGWLMDVGKVQVEQ